MMKKRTRCDVVQYQLNVQALNKLLSIEMSFKSQPSYQYSGIFLKSKACKNSPERPDFTIHITAHKYRIV